MWHKTNLFYFFNLILDNIWVVMHCTVMHCLDSINNVQTTKWFVSVFVSCLFSNVLVCNYSNALHFFLYISVLGKLTHNHAYLFYLSSVCLILFLFHTWNIRSDENKIKLKQQDKNIKENSSPLFVFCIFSFRNFLLQHSTVYHL